jgi:hypothetical protein
MKDNVDTYDRDQHRVVGPLGDGPQARWPLIAKQRQIRPTFFELAAGAEVQALL